MRRRKKIWLVSPLFYAMAAIMAAMALASYRYNKILFVIEMTLAAVAILAVASSDLLYRQNISTTMKSAGKALGAEKEALFHDFSLPVAVVAPPMGDIVWANEAFLNALCGDGVCVGENIQKYLYPKTFRQLTKESGSAVSHGGREYTVYPLRTQHSYVLYFVDDTYFKQIHKEYREKKPVVCLAAFDNREEMARDSMSGEDSRISAEVEAILRDWTQNILGGVVRRLANGRYLIITDDAHIENAKSKRFQVLDAVREIKSSNNKMSATVSIGVGRGAVDIAESERWARQALDMALGRGGDQVAVKQQGDSYEFFGGLSKGVEKRDKVRTRVIAATLSDHVMESDHVFIMGHKNSDLDCVGAAVGLWAPIHKGLEKPCHIVLNRSQTLAGPLVDNVAAAYPEESVFLAPGDALQMATEKSLLIVVDTHSVNFVENHDLLERIPRVVVVDHHRMMVSHIKNALIFYHEPYASSASEMVAELAQYIKASSISAVDAQAMLAGIALDTKNFVLKTGVRTFEASAFLRRRGADTVTVKKLFSNSLETYKQRSQMVAGAEIYKGCAIATSSWDTEDLRIASAQAADELLSIEGVRASFVLYRSGSDINVSARSLGELNVQLVLEEFGGGGHFTMAGAQIKNMTLSDARRALIRTLDEKLPQLEAKQ